MEAQQIAEKVRAGIPRAEVEAVCIGGDDHFEVTVVSDAFDGQSMVAQHRMVYAALGDAMRSEIHALVIKTMTPDQYRQGLVTDIERT